METIVYTMRTKCHLHVCYTEQVTGVKKEFCRTLAEAIFLLVVVMETIVYACVHLHLCHTEQVTGVKK